MNPSTTATRPPTRTPTATRVPTRPVTGTSSRATTRSTSARGSGSSTATITTNTTSATISPTATPEPSGGLAPGAIGGIAGGVVALVALVGVVFYKRRKRTTASGAASKKGGGGGDSKDEPIYMHASNYSSNNHKHPPSNNGISGPMALTAESDFEASAAAAAAAPSPYGRPSQQDNRGPPGAGPFGGPGGDTRNNNFNQQGQLDNYHGGRKSGQDDRYNNNNNNSRSPRSPNDDKAPLQHDYYDDVQDYYDGPHESLGAQRSVVSPRDLTHGNLTPAPEYYLGKEDIDPRRDLRGLDEPETYIRKANMNNNSHQEPPVDQKGLARNRRSSVSSDGDSAYLTLEQAQQAHQKKMQGHKESIGSVSILIDNSNKNQKPTRAEEPQSPGTPSFAHDNASIAISDSVMSMMPSLPPINSPMPYNNNNGSNQSSLRPKDSGLMSPGGHDDPYAESAFSEDFSSYPNSPHYAPHKGAHPSQQHPYPQQPTGPHSPFPPGTYGPGGGGGHGGYPQQGGNGYRGNGYGPGPNHGGYPGSPPYNGYGGGGARPQRGPGSPHGGPPGYGGGGGGPGRNGPGYGPGPGGRGPPPSNYGPQNGYNNGYQPRGGDPGPGGYRQHPSQQQRDPYYGRAY